MIDQPPSAPQRGTGLAFVQHWDWVAEKGLMPRNTAMGIRAAASQILKVDDGWEALDVRQMDANGLMARFRNLSKLSPASLATYESRFRSGLDSYLSYLDNPASYQPKAKRSSAQRDGGRPVRARPGDRSNRGGTGAQVPIPASGAPPAEASVASGVRLVVYPFPVRSDVFAELKLPADLTGEEAERLAGFLRAIALAEARG